jgi:hypothetical protein
LHHVRLITRTILWPEGLDTGQITGNQPPFADKLCSAGRNPGK